MASTQASCGVIAALGLRGAYVLPAIAFIVLLPLLDAMRRHAAPDASFTALALIALAANPLLLYSLEYWEHAPASAMAASSSAAALVGLDRRRGSGWIVASGVFGGLSILLRPEAACYVAGVAFVLGFRLWTAFGCGVAAILLPFAFANYVHSGTAIGPHAAASLAPLHVGYLSARWQRIDAWLWPHSFAAAAGFAFVAAAWLAAYVRIDLRKRQTIGLVGVALISILAAQRLLPRESLWQAFPVALLAFVPASPLAGRVWHLHLVAALSTIGILLTAPNDGGAQWGARFLLVIAPVLIVLAARSATDVLGGGGGRAIRFGLVALILIAGLATSRAAYRELRGSKRPYARIVSTTASLTSPGEVILTNVWWFDQIAAPLIWNSDIPLR